MPDPTTGIALQWHHERDQLAQRVRELEAALRGVIAALREEFRDGWQQEQCADELEALLGAASDG